jgi:hypothetical protein
MPTHRDPKTNELLQTVSELKPLDQAIKLSTALREVLPDLDEGERGRAIGVIEHNIPVREGLRGDLTDLLNSHSAENASDTPDHILAEYLVRCLDAFDVATLERTRWYER